MARSAAADSPAAGSIPRGAAFPVAAWIAPFTALWLAVEDWSNSSFRSIAHTEKRAFASASETSACADIRESRADSPRMRSKIRVSLTGPPFLASTNFAELTAAAVPSSVIEKSELARFRTIRPRASRTTTFN